MINNLEHNGSEGNQVSGNIEVEFLIVHGIEAPPLDARVRFRHARTVTIQSKLDVWV